MKRNEGNVSKLFWWKPNERAIEPDDEMKAKMTEMAWKWLMIEKWSIRKPED